MDSWEEYYVFHHKFVDWLEINGYNSKKLVGYSIKEQIYQKT